MQNLKRITIGKITYPIKVDLNVLEHIQQEYGTINQFEREILGLKVMKDKKGNPVYKEDGELFLYRTEPSIRAIKMVLPAMINEGLSIEADEYTTSWKPVSEKDIFQNCNINFIALANIIHEEFKRCFVLKK